MDFSSTDTDGDSDFQPGESDFQPGMLLEDVRRRFRRKRVGGDTQGKFTLSVQI